MGFLTWLAKESYSLTLGPRDPLFNLSRVYQMSMSLPMSLFNLKYPSMMDGKKLSNNL
jgi:hypothetical protein